VKYLIIFLLLFSCTKEDVSCSNIQFSAAYPTEKCLGSNPEYIILYFQDREIRLNVKEVNTGIVSIETFELPYGGYVLKDFRTFNKNNEQVASASYVFTLDGLILKTVPSTITINRPNTFLGTQINCKFYL